MPILQGPSGFIFILFSCPLHPFWSVIIEKDDQMGWRLKIYGLTIQGLWVDYSNDLGGQFKWLGLQFKRRGSDDDGGQQLICKKEARA